MWSNVKADGGKVGRLPVRGRQTRVAQGRWHLKRSLQRTFGHCACNIVPKGRAVAPAVHDLSTTLLTCRFGVVLLPAVRMLHLLNVSYDVLHSLSSALS